MAKVTPGFKLYLYQLLSRELGTGKQTLLPQVEEALAADDIIPSDLECDSIQELVEACSDFLKLRVFKKGRAYVTVLKNEDWDQMLSAPPEKSSGKKAPSGGPKTWKKKKSGKKTLKAVKPGKQRREREAAEAAAAEAAAELARQQELEAQCLAEEATAQEPQVEETPEETPLAEPAQETEQAMVDEAPAEKSPDAPVARTVAEIMEEARAAEAEAAAKPEVEPEPVVNPEPEAEPVVEAEPEPEAAPEPEPEVAPAPEPAPEPAAPAAPEPEPISLTITYDPYEDMERELERQAAMRPEPAPEPRPKPKPAPSVVAPGIPSGDLPQDFGAEVSCKDALLRILYQLLPYEVEPMAVLDEDWRVARSTGTVSGSRSRVSFPLHYLHEDGTPITVTLRKTARNLSAKKWNLALVDGDDGTGETHISVGYEGLPASDEGAWSDLSGTTPNPAISPLRELAQDMVIGSWDRLLGSLAATTAPERWNYPGEGAGKSSRYGILREYLTCTYHCIRCQELVAKSADGSFAAFNTGLLTAFGEDIYACMTARKGDIPWQFAGFATAGSGELGARLTGTISPLPEQANYLSTIESVVPSSERLVILDLEAIVGRQLGRLPRAFLTELLEGNDEARELLAAGGHLTDESLTKLTRIIKASPALYRRLRRRLDDAVEQSLRTVRASYRLAVPVYDPAENRTKLLVPLCLVEDGKADCALVLDLQPSGAYRAAALLSLPRAYACARVISREQPSWLSAKRVL